jgi:hypothetical protein
MRELDPQRSNSVSRDRIEHSRQPTMEPAHGDVAPMFRCDVRSGRQQVVPAIAIVNPILIVTSNLCSNVELPARSSSRLLDKTRMAVIALSNSDYCTALSSSAKTMRLRQIARTRRHGICSL